MKTFYTTTLFLLSFVLSLGAMAQVGASAPYSANFISVNQAGSVWAFGEGGSNGSGLYYSFNGWNFIEYDLSKGVVAASSTYGEILIANGAGEMKEWNNNNKIWLPYRGITGVKDVFISKRNGNNKFALGTVKGTDGVSKYGLWQVANISTRETDWVPVLVGDPHSKSFIKATNDVSGNLYLVTESGRLMARYANDTKYNYIQTDNKFVIDALIGEDGALYMMERGGTIYKRNSTTGAWVNARLSAASWGVDDKGNVYGVVNKEIQAIKNGTWTKVSVENPNKLDNNGNTPLTAAVVLNSQTGAKSAIDNGSSVNMKNRNGDTPAILATKLRNAAMISLLATNGADMNIKDASGHAPLYYAVQSGDESIAQAVLIGKGDPNLENVVTIAVENKDKEMIMLLSNYEANLSVGLEKAAELNDAEVFKTLIDYGAKLTTNKPFELAVDRNNMDLASICLDNGADKNQALNYAVQRSNKDLIGLCLQKGADANAAIDYVLRNNDAVMAGELISVYGVNANKIMENAVPGAKTNSTTQAGVNMSIAAVALTNGAKPDGYFKYAVDSKNTALVELLMLNGGKASKLLEASVAANNVEYATFAFDNGADANKNSNLLIKAIDADQTDMAVLFIERGANAADSRFIKAAVNKSNVAITKLLLENGAPTEDHSLITTAITNGKEEIVRDLLAFGADPNAGIQLAVDKNSTNMTMMLLEAGAVATGDKLISTAGGNGNLEIVSALVQRGANPDSGMLPAINGGHDAVFNFLLENGANSTSINYVVAAVTRNRVGMFKTLVENGAPVAYTSNTNDNLLHIAARNDSYQIAEILIRKGVDVNQKNSEGRTPLHIAANVGRNNLDLCTLFIDNGADVNATDNKGKSVLKVADGRKLKDYLKSKGATK